jgi:hypothetical protein
MLHVMTWYIIFYLLNIVLQRHSEAVQDWKTNSSSWMSFFLSVISFFSKTSLFILSVHRLACSPTRVHHAVMTLRPSPSLPLSHSLFRLTFVLWVESKISVSESESNVQVEDSSSSFDFSFEIFFEASQSIKTCLLRFEIKLKVLNSPLGTLNRPDISPERRFPNQKSWRQPEINFASCVSFIFL